MTDGSLPADRRYRLPPHAAGQRIGLFGGSFNPPHAAHRAVSLFAMKRLRLDHVWWLVSPGNPLKDNGGLPPLADRMAAATALARHPRIAVTDVEAQAGTRYSIDTVRLLQIRCPGVRFVWVMGLDNLTNFHRWRDWRGFFTTLPIAVVDRGGSGFAPLAGRAAQAFAASRLPETAAPSLPDRAPPAWTVLRGCKLPHSSTALRAAMARRG